MASDLLMSDTHCHLGQYPGIEGVLSRAVAASVRIHVATNRPSEYRCLSRLLDHRQGVEVSLGMHPEVAGSVYELFELEIFRESLSQARWLSEIGLDAVISETPSSYFGGIPTLQKQESMLGEILSQGVERKVLSVHSRGSEDTMVDMLRECGAQAVIFHWYTGSLAVAKRCLDAGFYFSINPWMLENPESDELVGLLPTDRILFETDGPFGPISGRSAEPSDIPEIASLLARVRDVSVESLHLQIERNYADLLRVAGIA